MNILESFQKRVLKIILKNKEHKSLHITIKQTFILNSVLFHYRNLQTKFLTSTSKSRNKHLIVPYIKKTISFKSSEYNGIQFFNMLPIELKTLKTVAEKSK